MKRKIFFAVGAVLVAAAVSAFAYISSERNATDGLFSANVEALANAELDNTKMHIWWVEYKGMAFTCTLGGYSPC